MDTIYLDEITIKFLKDNFSLKKDKNVVICESKENGDWIKLFDDGRATLYIEKQNMELDFLSHQDCLDFKIV